MVLILTPGSMAISLALMASNPEVVSAKKGRDIVEKGMFFYPHFTWGQCAVGYRAENERQKISLTLESANKHICRTEKSSKGG